MKEFKEIRSQAFEAFVNALTSINKPGRFNNFDLSYLTLPLNSTTESMFLGSYMLESYLKF